MASELRDLQQKINQKTDEVTKLNFFINYLNRHSKFSLLEIIKMN